PHLAVPGGDESGASETVTGKDHGAVVHHGDIIRTLHRLPTRKPAETRDMASRIFFLRTHIDKVYGFLRAPVHHGLRRWGTGVRGLGVLRESGGVRLGSHESRRRRRWEGQPVSAGFELVARKHPARGAFFQAIDVLQAHALKDSGPNDAACASGTVD